MREKRIIKKPSAGVKPDAGLDDSLSGPLLDQARTMLFVATWLGNTTMDPSKVWDLSLVRPP